MPTRPPLLQQAALPGRIGLVGLDRTGTSINADFPFDALLVTDPPLPDLPPAQPQVPSVMANTLAGK